MGSVRIIKAVSAGAIIDGRQQYVIIIYYLYVLLNSRHKNIYKAQAGNIAYKTENIIQ